ncbi:hypothetical protein [Alkalibacillus haloalkaliphilus]|uniref:Yip1 domain-containing protein n=1 Tax=Alkalibacillus haloalkaliphilus TaxID=94136 RepID=A0A511W6A8_9BACI|nr:hypothetical protein [Alkalibacillus haloalkaliphilus]GEN46626.1 hypothetical protein AHA02nite_24020 [Alkalibacillus haloalkaliphilus]
MGALTCSKCYNHQAGGNFCENCGHALVQGGQQVIQVKQIPLSRSSRQQTSEPSAISTMMRNYAEFYKKTLKNPTHALKQSDHHYGNAIATLLLLSITFALGIYLLMNAQGVLVDTNAFQIISRLTLGSLLILVAGFVGLIISLKIGGINLTYKEAMTQYGTLAVPFTLLTMLSMITGLSSSVTFTLSLAAIGLLLFVAFVPMLTTFFHILQTENHRATLYLSFLAFGVTILTLYVMFRIYLADLWVMVGRI